MADDLGAGDMDAVQTDRLEVSTRPNIPCLDCNITGPSASHGDGVIGRNPLDARRLLCKYVAPDCVFCTVGELVQTSLTEFAPLC